MKNREVVRRFELNELSQITHGCIMMMMMMTAAHTKTHTSIHNRKCTFIKCVSVLKSRIASIKQNYSHTPRWSGWGVRKSNLVHCQNICWWLMECWPSFVCVHCLWYNSEMRASSSCTQKYVCHCWTCLREFYKGLEWTILSLICWNSVILETIVSEAEWRQFTITVRMRLTESMT